MVQFNKDNKLELAKARWGMPTPPSLLEGYLTAR
jgi:hypothetical protein